MELSGSEGSPNPLFSQSMAERLDKETSFESVGKSQQDRQDEIRHAREFRHSLIEDALIRIAELKEDTVEWLVWEQDKFYTTERRRQNYVEKYEARDQVEIEELLSGLDLDSTEHFYLLMERLRLVYADLKMRLMIVEMETRRLVFKLYGQSTHTKETREERIVRLLNNGEEQVDIADVVLTEIDGMREEDKDEVSIFRALMLKYHPDVSEIEKAKEITQLIIALYDSKLKHFVI
jgi:hypothetical protein